MEYFPLFPTRGINGRLSLARGRGKRVCRRLKVYISSLVFTQGASKQYFLAAPPGSATWVRASIKHFHSHFRV